MVVKYHRRKFDDDADWLPQKDRLFVLKQPVPHPSAPAPAPLPPVPIPPPLPQKQGPPTRKD